MAIRSKVIPDTTRGALHGVIRDSTADDATVYTDEHSGIARERGTLGRPMGKFVPGMAHVNGVESFWAMVKQARRDVYHKISKRRLQRYIDDFSSRHDVRCADAVHRLGAVVSGMAGKRLTWADPIADNGPSSGVGV